MPRAKLARVCHACLEVPRSVCLARVAQLTCCRNVVPQHVTNTALLQVKAALHVAALRKRVPFSVSGQTPQNVNIHFVCPALCAVRLVQLLMHTTRMWQHKKSAESQFQRNARVERGRAFRQQFCEWSSSQENISSTQKFRIHFLLSRLTECPFTQSRWVPARGVTARQICLINVSTTRAGCEEVFRNIEKLSLQTLPKTKCSSVWPRSTEPPKSISPRANERTTRGVLKSCKVWVRAENFFWLGFDRADPPPSDYPKFRF